MISVAQYNKLMKKYNQTGKVGESAAYAGVDRGTARKYIGGKASPGEPRAERHWRTHADAFAGVWPEVEGKLRREPELQAKTLWEELLAERPGEFHEGQRRTFERRVAGWKERHGGEPELFFSQEHRPGEGVQLDWVDATRLRIRIGGEDFAHKLVHTVLPYSNWEWARVSRSESFLSLKVGLQSALWELGGGPAACQTDQSSTATHQLHRGSSRRDYNARYLGLLAHFGMKPRLIGVGSPHQNGDVESSHGHLVSALDQQLMLRGSREFDSVGDYEAWLFRVLQRRNAPRQKKLAEERVALKALPEVRLPEYEEEEVRVNRESIVRVGKQGYSVPSRWAGRSLRARISESEIAFYHRSEKIAVVDRRSGDAGVYVDWRHVIGALSRKPGAFLRWRHRESMFPGIFWRRLYDGLSERHSQGRAEREYLGMLRLAAEHGLSELEELIRRIGPERVSLDSVRRQLEVVNAVVEMPFEADLSGYDRLVGSGLFEAKEVVHG